MRKPSPIRASEKLLGGCLTGLDTVNHGPGGLQRRVMRGVHGGDLEGKKVSKVIKGRDDESITSWNWA